MSLCTIALERIIVKPSLEDLEIGNEGLVEDIWEKIKKFFKNLWNWIVKVWYKILTFFNIKKKNTEQDIKDIGNLTDKITEIDNQITKNIISEKELATDNTEKTKTIQEIIKNNKTYSNYVYENIIQKDENKAKFIDFNKAIKFYTNCRIEAEDLCEGFTKLSKELLSINIDEFYSNGIDPVDMYNEQFSNINMFKYTRIKSKDNLKCISTYALGDYLNSNTTKFPLPESFENVDTRMTRDTELEFFTPSKYTSFEQIKNLYRTNARIMNIFIDNANRLEMSSKKVYRQYKNPVYDRFLIRIGKILKGTNEVPEFKNKPYLEESSPTLRGYDLIARKISYLYQILTGNAVNALVYTNNIYDKIADSIHRLKTILTEVYNGVRAVKPHDRVYK